MTRHDLITAALEDCTYGAAAEARVMARFKRYLDEGVKAVIGEPGVVTLVDSDTPYTFASVPSQARYVIPEGLAYIRHLSERTNDWRLQPMSLAAYRAIHPDPSSYTGTPTHYVPIGQVGVAVQPADASAVFVDSTSASDVWTAYIEGFITGGYQRTASITMTGTTAVSLDAAITSFVELNDFHISRAAVGTVTLHEDASGGTELARITIGQTRPHYYGFYLWPTPSAVVSYYADYRRNWTGLTANTSEPPWPADHHDLLVAFVAWREWTFKGDLDRAGEAKQRYQRGLSRLKYATQTQTDELLVMGRGRRIGHSRLGAYYPADMWTGE